MDLLIDIGNSFIKYAICNEKFDEFEIKSLSVKKINELIKVLHSNSVRNIVVSSVIDLPSEIKNELEQTKGKLIWVSEKNILPFKIEYETPGSLGADRITLMCGVFELYPSEAVLLINCGSCITYNFINKNGIFKGGAISPGLEMRFKAMNQMTGKLPLVSKKGEINLTGPLTTETAIRTGVIQGIVFEINGFVDKYLQNNPALIIILSGGDRSFFANKLKNKILVNDNVAFTGLKKILKLNV